MTLKEMTQTLVDSGFTQASLADALVARGVQCSQPTIWRILNTDVDPCYSLGDAIRALYLEKTGCAA